VKRNLSFIACLVFACLAVSLSAFAQNADDPASRDDIILLLRTMHSHDFIQKTMSAQLAGVRQLMHEQYAKGDVPADFDSHFSKTMDELIKGMPVDEITDAMIPSYQKHFTHGDIEAMNAFYSSPVGQKVLEELPAVMQEGMQAAGPIVTKYISTWQDRMKQEFHPQHPAKSADTTPQAQN